MKIVKIKDWINQCTPQFKMIPTFLGGESNKISPVAKRLKDNEIFTETTSIVYEGRKAYIIGFMPDYINVHIQVKKDSGRVVVFDPNDYDKMYVAINNIIKEVYENITR